MGDHDHDPLPDLPPEDARLARECAKLRDTILARVGPEAFDGCGTVHFGRHPDGRAVIEAGDTLWLLHGADLVALTQDAGRAVVARIAADGTRRHDIAAPAAPGLN